MERYFATQPLNDTVYTLFHLEGLSKQGVVGL